MQELSRFSPRFDPSGRGWVSGRMFDVEVRRSTFEISFGSAFCRRIDFAVDFLRRTRKSKRIFRGAFPVLRVPPEKIRFRPEHYDLWTGINRRIRHRVVLVFFSW